MSFKSLVSVVSEQRQEIKQALTLFPYFQTWEPDLVAECCRVSSVVEFPPDEIILGPDTGNSHAVYFILEGVCKMLRNLFVAVKRESHQKKPKYKLYKYFPSKALNFESKNEGYVSRLFNQNHNLQEEAKPENGSSCQEANYFRISKESANDEGKKTVKNSHEILVFHTKAPSNEARIGEDVKTEINNESQSKAGTFIKGEAVEEIYGKGNFETLKLKSFVESKSKKIQLAEMSEAKEEIPYGVDQHVMVLEECRKKREDMMRVFKKATPPEKPKNATCFFLQIGFLSRGACFGLEKFENENFIMTATTVKCLKIPRRFLLQHNPCNIWNRIRLFHSLHLPKEERIFEYFKSHRMWMERKKTQTQEIMSLKSLPYFTSRSEVPYSIRLADLI